MQASTFIWAINHHCVECDMNMGPTKQARISFFDLKRSLNKVAHRTKSESKIPYTNNLTSSPESEPLSLCPIDKFCREKNPLKNIAHLDREKRLFYGTFSLTCFTYQVWNQVKMYYDSHSKQMKKKICVIGNWRAFSFLSRLGFMMALEHTGFVEFRSSHF